MLKKPIYLDYQSTTPVDPRVFEAMRVFFCEEFGNPASVTHEYGDRANNAVENARHKVATVIQAHPSEIVFTSGATESNNLAIQGIIKHLRSQGKIHIITSQMEHKAVLDVVGMLEEEGFQVTKLKPDMEGNLDLSDLRKSISKKTGLISIMHVNNEVGSINDIETIGKIAAEFGILFHSDAAQSFGKIPINVQKMNIHLLSISGHKIYGPKGIGALYVRKDEPKITLKPLVFGGGQELGMRSGTLAVPLIVGLGEASRIANMEIKKQAEKTKALQEHLLAKLIKNIPDVLLNGSMKNRIASNLNISFLGVESNALINNMRNDIAISNGSACNSIAPVPSHVLRAMGMDRERISSAIRIGFGRETRIDEIDYAADCIIRTVKKLRLKLLQPV